jgi:glycosyltransferase involved in cell wall biosynthesis
MKPNDDRARTPRILFVSPYPPSECNLAIFIYDLHKAICSLRDDAQANVIAVTKDEAVAYSSEVVFEIRRDRLGDYGIAAEYVNYSAVDVICIQHDSGVFGGADGRFITEFLKKLRKPVVTTLHTVSGEPSPGYRYLVSQIASLSDHLIAPSSNDITILKDVYNIPEEKVSFIPQLISPETARGYLELLERIAARPKTSVATLIPDPSNVRFMLPRIKLDHLISLTDDTSVFQHAAYGVPDRRFGYSFDDAARALVVTLMHFNKYDDKRALELTAKYLSFLQQAQTGNGNFYKCMSYGRQFSDDDQSEDTAGRAMWGLGAAVAYAPDEGLRALAREMFERGLEALNLHHPRAIAYAICGLSSFLRRYETVTAVRRKLLAMADNLVELFEHNNGKGWHWFSEEMTYANAKMPHALLLAYQTTRLERFEHIGLSSLDFLLDLTYQNGYFDFIGNRGWYRRGGERARFDQQPIEAGYTAEACLAAHEITGLRRYLEAAQAAAEWLLGRNRLSANLYDSGTGACADALEPYGPGRNQGAEATICAMLALLAVTAQRNGATESATSRKPVVETVKNVFGEALYSFDLLQQKRPKKG